MNMKILVLSDTHHDLSTAVNIVNACRVGCDLVVHLGDTVRDFENLKATFPDMNFAGVQGNNDLFVNGVEREMFLNLDGVKVLMCHGHEYGVKRSTDQILLRGQAKGADLVLFGHTHVPEKMSEGGIILFNPGAVIEGNFGIVSIFDSKIASADIFRWDRLRGKIV